MVWHWLPKRENGDQRDCNQDICQQDLNILPILEDVNPKWSTIST